MYFIQGESKKTGLSAHNLRYQEEARGASAQASENTLEIGLNIFAKYLPGNY